MAGETQKQGGKVPVEKEQARGQAPGGSAGEEARETGIARPGPSFPAAFAFGRPLSPFGFLRRMMEDMDRMFEDAGGGLVSRSGGTARGLWSPQVEVVEREGKLLVRADLPGLTPDDVKVQVVNHQLVLDGERRYAHEEEKGGLWRSERSYGSFHREIPLPEGVDVENASASFDNGVLEVSLQLPAKQQGKRIEVKGGAGRGEQKPLH